MRTGSYQGRRFYVEGKDRTVLWGIIVLFLLLGMRLFSLQVIKGEHYLQISEENRIRLVPIEAPRGLIFDRNGTLLVENFPSYTVSILPQEVSNIDATLERLGSVIDLQRPQPVPLHDRRSFNFAPIKLKRDVSFDIVSYVEEHRLELPGVLCQVEPKRRYNCGPAGAHVLGYTGEISERELKRYYARGYLSGWAIGKEGVERSYEGDLKGSNGLRYLEVDARGREVGLLAGKDPISPVPGKNLHLTIDIRLQRVAEEVFEEGWIGALVALDPQTGEILAMVSKPAFDPNQFSAVMTAENWEKIYTDPCHPLLNRAVSSSYPPGSTLKILTAAAGLEVGLISTKTRFQPCTGEMKFGNRVFHCWVPEGHGAMTVRGALIQSCDVFFYQLGQRLGVDTWSQYAAFFGLGNTMGIDLGGEEGGLVPDSDYYNRLLGKRKWSPNVILNLAVGQGELLVTPLQLAVFAGIIGTEGTWCQPHVLKGIELSQSNAMIEKNVLVKHVPEVSKETLKTMKKAMVDVVNSTWGTGKAAAIEGVAVGGKTGTSQNPHGDDHALFMCFAPADDPVIALAVIVENGGKGGRVAAPLAKRVIEAYLFDRYEEKYVYGQPTTEKF
ncbi:MAG: penicillin-binding protein 2 [Gemmatimonadota bacterium]|nr:MAG: penicillin-binding protein 2 [Gemmatimonadota bacterium]